MSNSLLENRTCRWYEVVKPLPDKLLSMVYPVGAYIHLHNPVEFLKAETWHEYLKDITPEYNQFGVKN